VPREFHMSRAPEAPHAKKSERVVQASETVTFTMRLRKSEVQEGMPGTRWRRSKETGDDVGLQTGTHPACGRRPCGLRAAVPRRPGSRWLLTRA
jgi:hypothetical protein